MFLCPGCGSKIEKDRCLHCGKALIPTEGILHFTQDQNIEMERENKHIGYDDILVHLDPSIVYRGPEEYGVYGACGRSIVEHFGKGTVVLDLGCGLGTASIPLARAGAEVIGVDISSAMLQYAFRRSKGDCPRLLLARMNAYDLRIEDRSVDIVIENATMHLVSDPERVYKEILRVLKPEGSLIHYGTRSLPCTEEQNGTARAVRSAFNDLCGFYENKVRERGFELLFFDNHCSEIEKKLFVPLQTIRTGYVEEWTDYMKYRVHRLEHKAFSAYQGVPDDVHGEIWKQTEEYAVSRYGMGYRSMPYYSRYEATYGVLRRKEGTPS